MNYIITMLDASILVHGVILLWMDKGWGNYVYAFHWFCANLIVLQRTFVLIIK